MCLLLVLDLLVLWKLLDVKETAIPTARKVVSIDSNLDVKEYTPVRIFQEEEETFEEMKEAFRLKIIERRKAWIESEIFNTEDNLRKFQLKNGIITEEYVYISNKSNFNNGLFSLRTV